MYFGECKEAKKTKRDIMKKLDRFTEIRLTQGRLIAHHNSKTNKTEYGEIVEVGDKTVIMRTLCGDDMKPVPKEEVSIVFANVGK